MSPTASRKTAVVTAAGTLLAGLAATLYGALRHQISVSFGGGSLVVTALTLLSLILVRHWINDTRTERAALAAAQREAEAERSRYFAAQAALENEQGRLHRDLLAERAGIAATLSAGEAKLRSELEEERAQLTSEAFRTGVEMERAGMLRKPEQRRNNLIRFPERLPEQQHAAPEPEREHSRGIGHGSVGP
ncbi:MULTISPECIES: hypothetical protein [unclassified Streptomyces]|uniref:hypothetical protein n=1 Tax=unclassified Streptomyces TaxID=2593676 RepID=UPI002E182447|nr:MULTISPECIES: hypothetical protein [unclassified Streptomyces]